MDSIVMDLFLVFLYSSILSNSSTMKSMVATKSATNKEAQS